MFYAQPTGAVISEQDGGGGGGDVGGGGRRGDVVKGWVIVIVMCHKVCERFYTMCFEYSCASIRHIVYTAVLERACARACVFACVTYI